MKGHILTVFSLIAILLFLLPNLASARDVTMELKLLKQNVNVGDEIPVEVKIDQVSNLKGVNILISFDNLKLEYKSMTKGTPISDFTEDIVPDPATAKTTGKIEYLGVLEVPGPGIDIPRDTILTLNFMAKSPGDAWVKLAPNDTPLGDSTANVIPTSIDTNPRTIQIGQVFRLKRVFNYPNPAPDASGNTVIRCESMAILEDLEARIYDISGELVKTINYEDFDTTQAPVYEYKWNCRNEKDLDVSNGTYILWIKAKLDSDEKYETWKIAILR